jgi:hypothetical protein
MAMASALRIKELEPFMEADTEQAIKSYLLSAYGELFAYLYVNNSSYTLAWPGAIVIPKLDWEALYYLPASLTLGRYRYNPEEYRSRSAVNVSFIVEDDPDELMRYQLTKPEDCYEYQKVLEDATRIKFARYDVDNRWTDPPLKYSFTAQNPVFLQGAGSELALRLPKSQPCLEGVLEWIVEHHSLRDFFQSRIDRKSFVAEISSLVGDTSGFSVEHNF